MVAYIVEQESTKTRFITSDIIDVFNTIEKVTDGSPVLITTKELSVPEFEEKVKFFAVLNISMNPPRT